MHTTHRAVRSGLQPPNGKCLRTDLRESPLESLSNAVEKFVSNVKRFAFEQTPKAAGALDCELVWRKAVAPNFFASRITPGEATVLSTT